MSSSSNYISLRSDHANVGPSGKKGRVKEEVKRRSNGALSVAGLDPLNRQAHIDDHPLSVAFIDFQKAYDFVFRDGLFVKRLGSRMFKVLHSICM